MAAAASSSSANFEPIPKWSPVITKISELKDPIVHATTVDNALKMIRFENNVLTCRFRHNPRPASERDIHDVFGSDHKFAWFGVPEKMSPEAKANFGTQYGSIVFEVDPKALLQNNKENNNSFDDDLSPAACRLYVGNNDSGSNTNAVRSRELSVVMVGSQKNQRQKWRSPSPIGTNFQTCNSIHFENTSSNESLYCRGVQFPSNVVNAVDGNPPTAKIFAHAELALAISNNNNNDTIELPIVRIRFVRHFATIPSKTLLPAHFGQGRCLALYNGRFCSDCCCGDNQIIKKLINDLQSSKSARDTLEANPVHPQLLQLLIKQVMSQNRNKFLANLPAREIKVVDELSSLPNTYANQQEAAQKLIAKITKNVDVKKFSNFTFAVVTTASNTLRSQTASRITSDLLDQLPQSCCGGETFILPRVLGKTAEQQSTKLQSFAKDNPKCLVLVFIDEVHYGSEIRDERDPLMQQYLEPLQNLPNVVFIGVTATPYNFLNSAKSSDGKYKIQGAVANNAVQITPPPNYVGFDSFLAFSHSIAGTNNTAIDFSNNRKNAAPSQPRLLRYYYNEETKTFEPKDELAAVSGALKERDLSMPLCLVDEEERQDPADLQLDYCSALQLIKDGKSSSPDFRENVFVNILSKVFPNSSRAGGKFKGVAVVRFRSAKFDDANLKAATFVNAVNKIWPRCAVVLASQGVKFGSFDPISSFKAPEIFPQSTSPPYGIVCVIEMVGMGDTFPDYVVSYDVRQCFIPTKSGERGSPFREFQQLGRAFGYGNRPILLIRQDTEAFDPYNPSEAAEREETSSNTNFFGRLINGRESAKRTFAILAQPQMGKTGTMVEVISQMYRMLEVVTSRNANNNNDDDDADTNSPVMKHFDVEHNKNSRKSVEDIASILLAVVENRIQNNNHGPRGSNNNSQAASTNSTVAVYTRQDIEILFKPPGSKSTDKTHACPWPGCSYIPQTRSNMVTHYCKYHSDSPGTRAIEDAIDHFLAYKIRTSV